jgi:hypothetical protein
VEIIEKNISKWRSSAKCREEKTESPHTKVSAAGEEMKGIGESIRR